MRVLREMYLKESGEERTWRKGVNGEDKRLRRESGGGGRRYKGAGVDPVASSAEEVGNLETCRGQS